MINERPRCFFGSGAVWLYELAALFISGGKFYCIHLFFKRFPKFIHTGISPDVRLTGNASGFVYRIESALAVTGHFNTERKTASENALVEK